MVKIVRDPNVKGTGAPRGGATNVSSRVSMGAGPVPKDTVSKSGIRRLIAKDPATGVSANIGTGLDAVGGFRKGVQAVLTTAMAGANNDMVFTSRVVGALGNSTRVRIVVSGLNTPLSIVVSSADITINSATDGAGAATSTATAVIAALAASAPAMALLMPVTNAGADTGAGVVAALGYTNLATGADSVLEGTNAVPQPSPTVKDGTGYKRRSTDTQKRLTDRSANRSVKKS